MTDVRPPDVDTRLTILRKRVQQDGIAGVDAGALELIAERVDANVRALEGALIRVVAFALADRPRRRPPRWPRRCSTASTRRPARRARRSPSRTSRRATCEASASRSSELRSAEPCRAASPGRARSPCTSRAS